jgi:hypothetical protein
MWGQNKALKFWTCVVNGHGWSYRKILVHFWGWSIHAANCDNVGHRMVYIQWDLMLKVSKFLWRMRYFSHSWSNGSWGFWFVQRQDVHLKQVRDHRDLIRHSYPIPEFGESVLYLHCCGYLLQASKLERQKSSPTYKDLDFIDHHPEGIGLESDTYSALIKTIQRDCRVSR